MERRFVVRKEALLAEAEVSADLFRGVLGRLENFLEPFVDRLQRIEQRVNARAYVGGLLSNLPRKNVESIAYLHDQDRIALQIFIGHSPWDHRPVLTELATQVGTRLGEPDGVIVFDPSGFPKKGTESVGVQRQWCGRLGKVENCQVGVFMGYASRKEHALVDVRLYLPKSWTKPRRRCRKCHVPTSVRFATRQQLALEMLKEQGHLLPHAWIAGDEELGRSSEFRGDLRELNERYLLAVPSNTLVHVLDEESFEPGGAGRRSPTNFVRVDRWARSLPSGAWAKIDVRDGEKGPLTVRIVAVPVMAKTNRHRLRVTEMLIVVRRRDESGKVITDYHLSNADRETDLADFAWVAKAEHRIEDCLKRCKSETGLADYEVRTWQGWHHHQTLSLIAAWFLTEETRRGKNLHAGAHLTANPNRLCPAAPADAQLQRLDHHLAHHDASTATQRTGAISSLENPQAACAASC
jgi:SRSO17 transposase